MAKKSQKIAPYTNAAASADNPADCVFDRKLARRDAKQLGLNKGDLSNAIKEVISTLNEAGFEAYIVGGGVRDALLGLKPKDFDAVTNATPNQVKEVFGKRCRIIGRRFLLCHVYSGRDMIEVATFRAPPKDDNHLTEDGMIMRDNVWGDIFQDVVRRDFSINALYYQPFEGFVYDFCGGLADVERRTLRLLGNTQKRVEEDPVRLLRALRFKAKLGFDFDDALEQQFNPSNWALLAQVSPHRLYDETQKMFTGGYLMPLLPLLFDYAAFEQLLFYPPKLITPLLDQVTVNTDKRIASGKSINPAFFYAALLWENYLYLLDKFKKNTPFVEAQIQAANKVMDKQRTHTAMPKFAEQFIKEIWLLQPRLAEPRKKNLTKLFENPRFRAAYDFLMLREQVEARNLALQAELGEPVTLDRESTNGMGHWWAWFQTLNVKQQQQAIEEFDLDAVRLRFANVVNGNFSSAADYPSTEPNDPPTATAKKSRRERRRERDNTADADGNVLGNAGHNADYSAHDSRNERYLTEQQQQEKDQLQQLSLASGSQVNQKPAQPLWGTPFNHRLAETDVIAPVEPLPVEAIEAINATKATKAPDEPSDYEPTVRTTKPKRPKKSLTREQPPAPVPATRGRRTPSSSLSVAERRKIAESIAENSTENIAENSAENSVENTVENIADGSVTPKPVTAHQVEASSNDPVTDASVAELDNTGKAKPIAALLPAQTAIPKKRQRKASVKAEADTVPDTQATSREPQTSEPQSLNVEGTVPTTTQPKRTRRSTKVSTQPTAEATAEISEASTSATAHQPVATAKKPPVKRTRKRPANAKPKADNLTLEDSEDREDSGE